MTTTPFDKLPDSALIRQAQLVPNQIPSKRDGHAPLLDFSPATLWRMVARGDFPKPLKLGKNITAWRVGEVRAWLAAQGAQSAGTATADTTSSKITTSATTTKGPYRKVVRIHAGEGVAQ